jgi:hypothetical protein
MAAYPPRSRQARSTDTVGFFGVLSFDRLLLVFERGNAQQVTWENGKKLSFEKSWEFIEEREPASPDFLPRTGVLEFVLRGVRAFQAANPFTSDQRQNWACAVPHRPFGMWVALHLLRGLARWQKCSAVNFRV